MGYLFRGTNIEKHNFRKYIADGNDLSQYKVWGKPVQYIKTEEGSYLLCSGYWALARHFNYIGDMVMCVGWTVACTGPKHGFPWIPLSYVAYFWIMDLHRLWRDEERCAVQEGLGDLQAEGPLLHPAGHLLRAPGVCADHLLRTCELRGIYVSEGLGCGSTAARTEAQIFS